MTEINITEAVEAMGFTETYATPLLNERESTHGNYVDTARIAQRLKRILIEEYVQRGKRGQQPLNFRQQESLDLICTKIARVISGDADNADHWNDIAGYAKLITEA